MKEHLIGLVKGDAADGRVAPGDHEPAQRSERVSTHLVSPGLISHERAAYVPRIYERASIHLVNPGFFFAIPSYARPLDLQKNQQHRGKSFLAPVALTAG